MRVAAAAFPLAPFPSLTAWRSRLLAMARFARDGGAQVVVFPEYLTGGLLGLDPDWQHWVEPWRDAVATTAQATGLTVVGGTTLVRDGGEVRNRALVAFPDGRTLDQDKLHPTPWEAAWRVMPTDRIRIFDLPGCHPPGGMPVRAAIPICYDVEFPEASRAAARAGAEVLLVPSWTDDDHGFWRVRRCAQARCVENVVAVVHAPLVGGTDQPGFEQACGAAGILTPCDTGFPPGGIAADGGWNQPVVVLADLDLDRLRRARSAGTVTPFTDARSPAGYRTDPVP